MSEGERGDSGRNVLPKGSLGMVKKSGWQRSHNIFRVWRK